MNDKRIEAYIDGKMLHLSETPPKDAVVTIERYVGDLPPPLRFNETTGELEPLSWQQEKQELIAALRFYADEGNYLDQDNSCTDPSCCTPSEYVPVVEDGGSRAREVLAKHGGE